MGKPPPHIIFKRIAKGMIKHIMPSGLDELNNAQGKLDACWAIHGFGSSKCDLATTELNEVLDYNSKYMKSLKNKKYEVQAMRYLAPAKRKIELKGREPIRFFNPPQARFELRENNLDSD